MATYTDGYTTQVKHAYGDRQYYKRNPPTEEDQPTNEALLPPRTSARAKCTYGEDTLPLRLKHIDDEKLSLDWSELIAVIHCAARSPFTVETYTIPQPDYDGHDHYNYYDDRSERNYYGQSQFAYYIKDFRLQWHQRQRRPHMTIITYGLNRLWISGSTHGYGRDDINDPRLPPRQAPLSAD